MRALAAAIFAGLAVLSLAGAAAAAARVSSHELALMPLPSSALGGVAAKLPLEPDSGTISNQEAAFNSNSLVSPKTLTAIGRLSGYALDYGTIGLGKDVFEVETSVELYRSRADATLGLAFWRHDAGDVSLLRTSGIIIVQAAVATHGLGASFAYSGSIKISGKAPFYGAQVMFQDGEVLGSVNVDATSPDATTPLAASAARKLAARIRLVLAGRLGGRPVALPATTKAGPPAHGPDLAGIALTSADLGGGKVTYQGYVLDTSMHPVSEYSRALSPGGPFAYLQERVALFQDPVEASYQLGVISGILASSKAWQAFGALGDGIVSFHPTVVKVHAGDESRAVLGIAHLSGGKSIDFGFIVVRTGSSVEIITVASPVSLLIPSSAVAELATIAADRALHGLVVVPHPKKKRTLPIA